MFRAIRSNGRPIGRMTTKPEVIVKLALTELRPWGQPRAAVPTRARSSLQELNQQSAQASVDWKADRASSMLE